MVYSLSQPATSDRDHPLSRQHGSVVRVFTLKPPGTAQIGQHPEALKLRDLLHPWKNTNLYDFGT